MRSRFLVGGLVSLVLVGASCGGHKPRIVPCFDEPKSESLKERTSRLGKKRENCVEVIKGHNDVRIKRINVVFVGVDYTDNQFIQKVYESASCNEGNSGLLSVEPYISNPDLINLWYVPKTVHIEGKNEIEDYKDKAYDIGIDAAEACDLPSRAIFVIVKKEFRSYAHFSSLRHLNLNEMNLENIGDYQSKYAKFSVSECKKIVSKCKEEKYNQMCLDIKELRGSQNFSLDEKICSIITNDGDIKFGAALISGVDEDKYLIGHEAGHSIIGLRDEYVNKGNFKKWIKDSSQEAYLKILKKNPVNCFLAKTKKECEENAPWKDFIGVEGVGCYRGCGYTNAITVGDKSKKEIIPVWRSFRKGMMKTTKTNQIGLYNESRSCDALHVITQNAGGICEKFGYLDGGISIKENFLNYDIKESTEYLLNNKKEIFGRSY